MINYLKKEIDENKNLDIICINCLNNNTIEKEKNVTVYNFSSIKEFDKNNDINNFDIILYSGLMNYSEKELDILKNYAYIISNKYKKLVTIGYWYTSKRTEEIHTIHIIDNDETTNIKIPGSYYSIEKFTRNTVSRHYDMLEQNKKNEPKRMNIDELFFENIDESNAIFKDELRKKKLIPILNGDVINTYEIQTTDKTYELIIKYREELANISKTVTNDKQLINGVSIKPTHYNNFYKITPSSKEDLINYFNIKTEYNIKEFLALKQNQMFRYEGMTYNEIIDAITNYYYNVYFRYESKLSQILESLNTLVDLDYLAEQTYKFLYNEDISFRDGINYMVEEFNINRFNNTEINLPFEDKINICKEIIDSLNIDCVHTFKPNELSNFLLYNIYHTNNMKELIEFAKHNTEIISTGAFEMLFNNYKDKQKRK